MNDVNTQSSIPVRPPAGTVDCHAHVMKMDVPLANLRHSAPAHDANVLDYLAVLDAHGVTYGLLTAPSFYGTNNALMLESVAASGGRLRGTAIVDPGINQDELAAMKAQGVCGVRLNWVRRDSIPDIKSLAYQRLLGKLRELDLHAELYLEGRFIPDVLPTLAASGAAIVVDHFGAPDPERGATGAGFACVLDAIDAGNTWVKLSAPFRQGGADCKIYARRILERSAGERAVWATDWPWVGFEGTVSYQQCLNWVFDWIPDEKLRHNVLVETPQKLLGFSQQ